MNGIEVTKSRDRFLQRGGPAGGNGLPSGQPKILDELKPGESVTICLPLFIAGGEEERSLRPNFRP